MESELPDAFALEPPVSEVVKMRRIPAGEMPPAERAPALRDAALRASRAPAVEIIARLSSERTKLKVDLLQAQHERDELRAEVGPLRAKVAEYEAKPEGLAITPGLEELRAELARRDAEWAASETKHEELARRAVERLQVLKGELEARNEELVTLRRDLEASDDRFDILHVEAQALREEVHALRDGAQVFRAELARKDELLATRDRIDGVARDADAAEIAALRATLDERSAEVAGLQTALDAEVAKAAEALAEHSADKDELDRLRRHCAALEQESVRAGALETDLQAATAALQARESELEALRAKAALAAREERIERSTKALALGFGNASVIFNERDAAAPRRATRRFDDTDSKAKPYPALPNKAAARMEKALRRVHARLARMERTLKKSSVAPVTVATPAPQPAAAVARATVSNTGPRMLAKGTGMLADLINANLALRTSAANSTTEKRGNNQ